MNCRIRREGEVDLLYAEFVATSHIFFNLGIQYRDSVRHGSH